MYKYKPKEKINNNDSMRIKNHIVQLDRNQNLGVFLKTLRKKNRCIPDPGKVWKN